MKTLFNALDSGESIRDFLTSFPDVTEDQVVEVLSYARQCQTHKMNIESDSKFAGIGIEPSREGMNFFTLLLL